MDGHSQGFSYLGGDVTQAVHQNVALSARVIPNFLTYKYHSGTRLIKATSPGLYTVAGVKLFQGRTSLRLYGGLEYRNTDLEPDDRSAKVRGNTTAGLVQGEFDTWLPTRTNLNVWASYSGTDSFFFERGRVKQQVTNLDYRKSNSLNVGLEQSIGRNPDFRQNGVGLLIEVYNIPYKIAFAVRGGYKHDSTFGDGAYWGLELYKGF